MSTKSGQGHRSPATITICTPIANGVRVEVRYEVIEAKDLESYVHTHAGPLQTRQRAENWGSKVQVMRIAINPDPMHLLTSSFSHIGCAVVDGNDIVAGNGRAMGLIEGYRRRYPNMANYTDALREVLPNLGLSGDKIEQPILVRRVVAPYKGGDARAFVEQSNRRGMLLELTAELAALDAAALGDMTRLAWGEDGKLNVPSAQLAGETLAQRSDPPRSTRGGSYDRAEVNRRVQLACLAQMSETTGMSLFELIALIEDDTARRLFGEILRFGPHLNKLEGDLNISGALIRGLDLLRFGISSVQSKFAPDLFRWNYNGGIALLEMLWPELMGTSRAATVAILDAMVEDHVEKEHLPVGHTRRRLRDRLREYLAAVEPVQRQRNAQRGIAPLLSDGQLATPQQFFVNPAFDRIMASPLWKRPWDAKPLKALSLEEVALFNAVKGQPGQYCYPGLPAEPEQQDTDQLIAKARQLGPAWNLPYPKPLTNARRLAQDWRLFLQVAEPRPGQRRTRAEIAKYFNLVAKQIDEKTEFTSNDVKKAMVIALAEKAKAGTAPGKAQTPAKQTSARPKPKKNKK